MKHFTVALSAALLLICTALASQSSDTTKTLPKHRLQWAVDGGLAQTNFYLQVYSHNVVVTKGRHSLQLGLGHAWSFMYKFVGGQLGYRFHPAIGSKNLDLYLQYQLDYFQDPHRPDYYPWITYSGPGYDVYVKDYRLLNNWLGAGIDYRLLGGLYVGGSASLGVCYREVEYLYRYNYQTTARKTYGFTLRDLYWYDRQIPMQIRLQLSYRFGKL